MRAAPDRCAAARSADSWEGEARSELIRASRAYPQGVRQHGQFTLARAAASGGQGTVPQS